MCAIDDSCTSPYQLTLVQAAELLRSGELRAEDYAADLLQRCRDGAAINAFSAIDEQSLLEAAREADRTRAQGGPLGRLHGVPLALKDNIASERLPTTAGTAALADAHDRRNAGVAERLYAEGALLLGKNTMHELAMGWTSDNPHFGRVANPHAPERISGGSSGGSAAAVAAMMVPAAIGSDTNGSIRIPSSFCGVAGFRPSVGRYPTEGVVPLSHTLDTVGPIARSAADLALLDAVMSGQPAHAPLRSLAGMRIAISPRYFLSNLEPEIERVFDHARHQLGKCGVQWVEADVPDLHALAEGIAPTLIAHESATALADWLAARADGLPMARLIDRAGSDLHASLLAAHRDAGTARAREKYRQALRRRMALCAAMQRYFAEHGVLAIMHPVTRVAAPLAGAPEARVSPAPTVTLASGSSMSAREAFGQNVSPASIAALPSVVLPAGFTAQGLPVGLAFDAPNGSDGRLLALADALESALGIVPGNAPFTSLEPQAFP